jgi:hypothetical protein
MSHVRVVVAPLAEFELVQRPLRLLYAAGVPMQQRDHLGGDQHQPGRTTAVYHIDERGDKRPVVPVHERETNILPRVGNQASGKLASCGR